MKSMKNPEPGKRATKILIRNLTRLRDEHIEFNTKERVALKAGIGEGSMGNLETPDRAVRASLDNIAKVASVYGKEAWELLHPSLPAFTISEEDYRLLQDLKKRFGPGR